ncbi:MAG TPA: ABC transporter substrate-binding protein [Candidatus Lustribacter sp.]|nr:ABC transporter substrate-binding protein [Candidatus Lustribacter sp.]
MPLSVSTSPDEDAVACLYGVSSGIFRRYGLDVSVSAANSGAATSAGVVGGSIDIGKASLLGLIAGHTKGVPFTLVAPASMYSSAAPVAGTLVRSDSAIRTARDLSGKTVSVQSLKGFLQVALMKWIDEHGGDSNSVNYIELSPSAASAALLAGRVDASTLANPSLAATLNTKKARVFAWSCDSVGKYYLQAGYFTTTDFAAKNADVIARFARAVAESSTYTNAHPAETVDMISKFTGVAPDDVTNMTRVTCGTKLDPAQIQPVVDLAVKYKIIATRFDAREIIWRA